MYACMQEEEEEEAGSYPSLATSSNWFLVQK